MKADDVKQGDPPKWCKSKRMPSIHCICSLTKHCFVLKKYKCGRQTFIWPFHNSVVVLIKTKQSLLGLQMPSKLGILLLLHHFGGSPCLTSSAFITKLLTSKTFFALNLRDVSQLHHNVDLIKKIRKKILKALSLDHCHFQKGGVCNFEGE